MLARPRVDILLQVAVKFLERYLPVAILVGRTGQAKLKEVSEDGAAEVQRGPTNFTGRGGIQHGQFGNTRLGHGFGQSAGERILQEADVPVFALAIGVQNQQPVDAFLALDRLDLGQQVAHVQPTTAIQRIGGRQ